MLNSIYRIQTSQTSGRDYKSCSPLYSISTTWRITGYICRDYFLGRWGIKGKRPNPTPSRTCTLVAEFTTNLCITSQCLRKTFSIEVCPSIYLFHFKSSRYWHRFMKEVWFSTLIFNVLMCLILVLYLPDRVLVTLLQNTTVTAYIQDEVWLIIWSQSTMHHLPKYPPPLVSCTVEHTYIAHPLSPSLHSLTGVHIVL